MRKLAAACVVVTILAGGGAGTAVAAPRPRDARPAPDKAAAPEARDIGDSDSQTASSGPMRQAPRDILARAEQHYQRGEFRKAIDVAQPLVDQHALATDDEITARRVLALSLSRLGERDAAEQQLRTILDLDPRFELNRNADPPEAVSILRDIRTEDQERLARIKARQREEVAEADRRRKEDEDRIRASVKPVVTERTVVQHSRLLAWVPFGAGQFQNGDFKKGVTFAVSQSLLGAASVALFTAVYFGYSGGLTGTAPSLATSDYDLASSLRAAQVIIGGLFWVDVAVGVIDALVHYQPEVVTERRLSSTTLAPYFSASSGAAGAGLSLQGAF